MMLLVLKFLRATVAALALVALFAASAAERTPDPAKRVAAEKLIADTNSSGIWQTDDTGEITHIQSGLTCAVATPEDIIQLTGLKVYESSELGGDVSCSFIVRANNKPGSLTLYAFLAKGRSDAELLGRTIAEIETVHPDWKRAGVPTLTMKIKSPEGDQVDPKTTRYTYTDPTLGPMSSSVWVAAVNGWAVMVRATYPQSEAMGVELISTLWWSHARLKVSEHATGDKQ